jgi:hypothetical protein
MADDVTTPLNPPVAPVEEKKLKEALLNVNVSQRSCEEKLFRIMVCIQVDCSA